MHTASPHSPVSSTLLRSLRTLAAQRKMHIAALCGDPELLRQLSRGAVLAGSPIELHGRPIIFRHIATPAQIAGSTVVTIHQHDLHCRNRDAKQVCLDSAAEHIGTLILQHDALVAMVTRAVEARYLYTDEEGTLVGLDRTVYHGHRETLGLLDVNDRPLVQAFRKRDDHTPFNRCVVYNAFSGDHSGYARHYVANIDDSECQSLIIVEPTGEILLGSKPRDLFEVRARMLALLKSTNLLSLFMT